MNNFTYRSVCVCKRVCGKIGFCLRALKLSAIIIKHIKCKYLKYLTSECLR